MRISDLLSMCSRNLTRRKFRTLLTVMGVVIGTCFIVVMISLGIAIAEQQNQMLESWGDLTVIQVDGYGVSSDSPLNDDAVASFQGLPGVDIATPIVNFYLENGNVTVNGGRRNRYEYYAGNLIGMYPEAMEKLGYAVSKGQMLPEGEGGGKTVNILFGEMAAYEFYDTRATGRNNYVEYWNVEEGEEMPDPFLDLMEEKLTLTLASGAEDGKNLELGLTVSGILVGDYGRGHETMYGGIIALDEIKRITAEFEKLNKIKPDRDKVESYDNVRVKCLSVDDVTEVEEMIHDLGFINTYSMEQERQRMQESAQQIQLILGAIGGVALVVSAISIMNTMIMSVYERTREIGVMKVLGCEVGNIRIIFLIEAGLIGLFGGIAGDALSYIASLLLNNFGGAMGQAFGMYMPEGGKISVIPLWLFLLGLSFATAVGLVSGIIPAMRAVKISALEAIRTE